MGLGVQAEGELDESNPVVKFMHRAGLGQYARELLRNGFDDMETLVDIEDEDMKDFGMLRGHMVKLRNRLNEYHLHQYGQEEESQTMRVFAQWQVPEARTELRRPIHMPAVELQQMPTEQIKSAVERSWEQVQELGTYRVGEILYRHTFALMPEAIRLFPEHVRMKYREWSPDETIDEPSLLDSPALRQLFRRYISAVGCVVVGIHDSHRLVPMLIELGARHAAYGVKEMHLQAMGKAFNLTLREVLGESFTTEVEAAWTMVYSLMSSVMLEGLSSAAKDQERYSQGAGASRQISNLDRGKLQGIAEDDGNVVVA